MRTQKFSKKEAIQFGWNIMKNNLGFFITILLIMGLIFFAEIFVFELLKENFLFLYFIVSIISWIINTVIGMGFIKIALKFCDNEKPTISDLFSCFHLLFKVLLGAFLYGLIVCAGLILFIIPGIIWLIKFWFLIYFIVDKEIGPIEALKKVHRLPKVLNGTYFSLYC